MRSYEIAFQTDTGCKRAGAPNQDSLLVLPADGTRGLPPLLVVADGMGGHAGGDVASRMVVEAMAARYRLAQPAEDPLVLLGECLQNSLEALQLHAKQEPGLSSMGSTVVAAILHDDHVTVANVGDSRAYLIHGLEMTLLSLDHSVVGEQVRLKIITEQEAREHPLRSRLTQSISPKRTTLKPHICQVPFGEDDTLVLCSDGLWGVIPESMLQSAATELPPGEAARTLVQLAIDHGGPDNITVIVARWDGLA